jgi:hypothetical protein
MVAEKVAAAAGAVELQDQQEYLVLMEVLVLMEALVPLSVDYGFLEDRALSVLMVPVVVVELVAVVVVVREEYSV